MIDNSAMNFANITLFAPTDQAFQMMDRERLERLITNEDCVEVKTRANVGKLNQCKFENANLCMCIELCKISNWTSI